MKTMKIALFLMILSNVTIAQSIVFETKSSVFTKHDIEIELAKYPKSLLQTYLPVLKVVSDDRICGRSEFDALILSSSCNTYKSTIHHELSSMFLNRYDVYVKSIYNDMYAKFVKLNGNFKYNRSNPTMRKIDPLSKEADYFYQYTYAMSDFENDFNMIAEGLFEDGAKVIKLLQDNPEKPVSKKIQIVLDFYKSLDSSFTVSYFKSQKL